MSGTMQREVLERLYHKADKVAPDGRVSALCFVTPRAINLKRASWTLRWEAVTCPNCLKLRDQQKARHG